MSWIDGALAFLGAHGLEIAGLLIAVAAAWYAKRANDRADDANLLSSSANKHAEDANGIAQRALQAQLDEGKIDLRVHVGLRMYGNEEAKPDVLIVNHSRFEVTVDAVLWFAGPTEQVWIGRGQQSSYPGANGLPCTMGPRRSMNTSFATSPIASDDDLYRITYCEVRTQCGHIVRALSPAWRSRCAEFAQRTKRSPPCFVRQDNVIWD